MKIVVTTAPFCDYDQTPLELLKASGHEVLTCPRGKFSPAEYREAVKDADALIAGTEPLNHDSLGHTTQLKLISRIGIGLDNVDFAFTQERGILVTYTPDGPSRSVAELTFGLLLDCIRKISHADHKIRSGHWERMIGELVYGKRLGLFGLGRIGKLVVPIAQAFGMQVNVHDIDLDVDFCKQYSLAGFSKRELLKQSDIVSLHLPSTSETQNYIAADELALMPKSSILINTSRGHLVDEEALVAALQNESLAGAGIDVFKREPYNKDIHGLLASYPQVVMTAHMGSCTKKARLDMEKLAAEAVKLFFDGQMPTNQAPIS